MKKKRLKALEIFSKWVDSWSYRLNLEKMIGRLGLRGNKGSKEVILRVSGLLGGC